MTLPILLTLLRVPLTAAIIWLVLLSTRAAAFAALACFVLAVFTDWLDGYLARRWGQTTASGALLDPIADKVLVLGLFATFAHLRIVPVWMVAVIALREALVTGLRFLAVRRRVTLPAVKEGKQKAACQMLTLGLILIWLALRSEAWVPPFLLQLAEALITGLLWLTLLLTVNSGLLFVRHYRSALCAALSR